MHSYSLLPPSLANIGMDFKSDLIVIDSESSDVKISKMLFSFKLRNLSTVTYGEVFEKKVKSH